MANSRRGRHTLTNRHRKTSRSLPRALALVVGLCAIAVAGTASAQHRLVPAHLPEAGLGHPQYGAVSNDDPGGHAQAGKTGTYSKSVMVAPPGRLPGPGH